MIQKRAGYDQFAAAMKNSNCMVPVLAKVAVALRSGNAVWIVGNVDLSANTNSLTTFTSGNWSDQTGYEFNNQLNNYLSQHGREIQCIDAGTNDDVNFNERTALFKVTGWKESP